MRSFLAALSLLLVTGCSAGGLIDINPEQPSAAPSSSSAAPTSPTEPQERRDGASPACEEVVAGIDAFNAGDYEETVAHFEKAVPIAEDADDGSRDAGLLLEAVRYYAELAPTDYPQAAETSREFARWKVVTLSQCVTGTDEPSEPTSPPVTI